MACPVVDAAAAGWTSEGTCEAVVAGRWADRGLCARVVGLPGARSMEGACDACVVASGRGRVRVLHVTSVVG